MGVDLVEKMILVINLVLGPLFLGRVIRTSLVMDALTKRLRMVRKSSPKWPYFNNNNNKNGADGQNPVPLGLVATKWCRIMPADQKPRSRNWGFCHGEVFGGVGWVGDSNVPCTCTHFWCYATGCFSLTCTHVGCYVIDFPWSRTHVRCYASDGVGWGGLGTVTFLAPCTHFWCYATGCFSLTCTHVGCYVIDFPWSRTHVRCYASDGVGWGQ